MGDQMSEPSEDYKRAASISREMGANAMRETSPFRYRGLSDRTVDRLVAYGIDAPERLLFITPSQLRSIPGVGKRSLAEIIKYRTRFVVDSD